MGSLRVMLSSFSCTVVSDSLQSHGLQHTRLPCPSSTPRVCSTHDTIQPSHPLSSPSPSVFSSIRVFSNESVLRIRWPKYWSFSFSISPSNEYLGLISFKIDWFDLFVVQGTLKSLLQHHSSKASVLQCSASLSALLLYGPALTCMHDYWKDHSLDYTDLWWMCREVLIYCWKKYQIAYPLGDKAHGSS